MFVLTQNFIKNIPNVDFMAILMTLATCNVRNAFKRPLRPNAPTVRVLSLNKCHFEGNWMGFQKIIPYKNPRHGAPGSIGSSTSMYAKWANKVQKKCHKKMCLRAFWLTEKIPTVSVSSCYYFKPTVHYSHMLRWISLFTTSQDLLLLLV